MNDLEKYIKDNIDSFNDSEMPIGHKSRFLKKLEEEKSPVHRIFGIVASIAAAIVLGLFIFSFSY